ncbi:MAG: copper resistance protein NlpE N-terminal domain-containing protein [Caldilinea sp.]
MSCLMVFGVVTPALASTPNQADNAGDLQVWASSLYPAADAPGMIEFVALYPNNAAEVITVYLTKGAIVETGEWEPNDAGGVIVTIVGNEEIEYDQPAMLSLTPVDDLLTDGVFTYHALTIVTPEEMDAMLEGAVADADANMSDIANMTEMDDFGVVWVSNVYPAADATGLITMIALYANGAMEQTSIYLTKGAITEIGVWEEDEDGAVTVTTSGTTEEEYAEEVTTVFELAGDTLVDGAFVLALWPRVTPEDMMATLDPSGTYVSNLYPAADAAGYIVVLSLYANNAAEQTTIYLTKGATTEVGAWAEEDDGSITVTITGTIEEEYEQESVTVYSHSDEMLQDGPFLLFKLIEVTPSMMDAMVEPEVVATFQSDTLPAASSPGRIITLTLYDDDSIVMSTDYLNDEAPLDEIGTWEENSDGTLTITITGRADLDYSEPTVITFELDEDQLAAVEYDISLFGSEGLTLVQQVEE